MAKIKTPQENWARSARKFLGFLGVLQGKTAKKVQNGFTNPSKFWRNFGKNKPNFELLEILAKINQPEKNGADLTLRGGFLIFITPVMLDLCYNFFVFSQIF